jgi:putative NADH-flavin reductase
MKIAIFGASGKTGHHLVKQSLSAGHNVTALVRNPVGLGIDHADLKCVMGDLFNPLTVQSVIQDADAVISVIGARKGGVSNMCTQGIKIIIEAMNAKGVKRLIALSAYGASETQNASFFIRFVRSAISEKMRDKDSMEELVRTSTTDWTLIRPPMLTNGNPKEKYQAGLKLKPGITGRIARADLAAFILKVLEDKKFIHQAPAVFNL